MVKKPEKIYKYYVIIVQINKINLNKKGKLTFFNDETVLPLVTYKVETKNLKMVCSYGYGIGKQVMCVMQELNQNKLGGQYIIPLDAVINYPTIYKKLDVEKIVQYLIKNKRDIFEFTCLGRYNATESVKNLYKYNIKQFKKYIDLIHFCKLQKKIIQLVKNNLKQTLSIIFAFENNIRIKIINNENCIILPK